MGKNTGSEIGTLQSVKNRFDADSFTEKERIIRLLLSETLKSGESVLMVHDLLLFCIAHAHSPAFRLLCEKALNKVIGNISSLSEKEKRVISDSGICGTSVIATYSYQWVQWMARAYPASVRFDSFGAAESEISDIILQLLPDAEREYFQNSDEPDVLSWMRAYSGKTDPLFTILQLFESRGWKEEICSWLFSRLEIYVRIDLKKPELSRTYTRGINRPVFYHTSPLFRHVDVEKILEIPIMAEGDLSASDILQLVEVKKRHLAALFRETDPATYADIRDVRLFDMGRGLEIALYGMSHGHRLHWESYIGFMAFKNNLPYGYGGAWMLGDSARIGTNIFEPFRGGESAWFFCQLMRLYRQLFQPSVFIAEPYQIGKDNPEGIQSGAFWFYYRLGYRPEEKVYAEMAAVEFKKINADRTYRSSEKILEKLAESNMIRSNYQRPEKKKKLLNTTQLSGAVSAEIAKRWNGDRTKLKSWVEYDLKHLLEISDDASWTAEENESFLQLGTYMIVIPKLQKWTRAEKERLVALLRMKGSGTDSDFAVEFRQFNKLIDALVNVGS